MGTGLQDTQPSHAEQGLQINVPEGVNAFDYFDQNASTTSNDDTLGTSDALDVDAHMLPVEHQGGPAPIDPDVLKLAIMTQDMNSFGASSGATASNERERAMTQLDYFAA